MDGYQDPVIGQSWPPQNNSMGTVGLVTGIIGLILAFCCSPLGALMGIVALVTGIIAHGQNQNYAVAGIVLGAISLALGVILTFVFVPFVFFAIMGAAIEGTV